MTGGLGFSRQGQDSLNSNRELLKHRKMMKENPHVNFENDQERKSAPNYDELRQWKENKDKRENRLKRLIFILVAVLAILAVVLITMNLE